MVTRYTLLVLFSFVLFSCSNDDDNRNVDPVGDNDGDENTDGDGDGDGDGTDEVSDRTIFVFGDASGIGDGLSWENAFTELQAAIDFSLKGDEIWVAQGTYIPDTETDRTVSFVMKDGVRIYGGFTGTETALDQRDWIVHQTILSGEIGDPNTTADNCYNVIQNTTNNLTLDALLDGFIITKGNAGDPEPYERGGGMFNKESSPTIKNCTFIDNEGQYGAGIYNLGGSSPYIENCSFISNNATRGGGGVYNFLNASPTMINCLIAGNVAGDQFGGGMYNFQSSPTVINTCITGNVAIQGGAIYNTNLSAATFINVTITGNRAEDIAGGMYNVYSEPLMLNSIIWANLDQSETQDIANQSIYNDERSMTEIGYSLVEFINAGGTNIDGTVGTNTPDFVSSLNPMSAPSIEGDFRVTTGAVGIDKGSNALNETTMDLLGNPRVQNSIIDLGAYEF
ncbi:choice-of-anchor Q domain-containing protein [Aquimarina sp. SS2-1]|uniref:choice-of-anchor Q domain-containing protein n=1 Tax=Aquimarina besae TaxID=3342247 RepID=UPI00366E7BE3